MVVKMVVKPIAKTYRRGMLGVRAAHCFGIAGRDEGDFGCLGPHSMQVSAASRNGEDPVPYPFFPLPLRALAPHGTLGRLLAARSYDF
jgi:hypothetical protein